jgi:hypothetical protein
MFQDQRWFRRAKRHVRDSREHCQVGGIDEDLREPGIAARIAAAKRIVGGETILDGASEANLRTIPACAETGTPQN